MAAKKVAAKPTTRRVFAPEQCHHRNAAGQPDCRKKKWTKNVNLCETHERAWQKAARERAKGRATAKAAEVAKVEAAKKPTRRTSERRAPKPPRQPIQRVASAEPQPAVVQLVAPE